MRSIKPLTAFAPHEVNRFLAPGTLASVFFMLLIMLDGLLTRPSSNLFMILYGLAGNLYILVGNLLVARSSFARERQGWAHPLTSGIALGLLAFVLPEHLEELFHILIILGVVATATLSGRYHTYINLLVIMIASLPNLFKAS